VPKISVFQKKVFDDYAQHLKNIKFIASLKRFSAYFCRILISSIIGQLQNTATWRYFLYLLGGFLGVFILLAPINYNTLSLENGITLLAH